MYKENSYSVNLMKLNSYYKDKEYNNKNKNKLRDINDKINSTKKLFHDIRAIKSQGKKKTGFQVKCYFNNKLIVDRKLKYNADHDYEINYKTTGKKINGKIAVYTSIYGNYDHLIEPLFKSDYCDYYAITDSEIDKKSVWQKYDTNKINGFEKLDEYHKSKFCKFFPSVLFPEYEYSIWIDGNVQIVADMYPLVDRLSDDNVMGTFMNPLHDSIYTEANFNVYRSNADMSQLLTQIDNYKKDGFPQNFGMREFSIIVRKHNDPINIQLMNLWWNEVNKYTMRDQISFPYILWKNNYSIDYIQPLGDDWRMNPRFVWFPHNWHITFNK